MYQAMSLLYLQKHKKIVKKKKNTVFVLTDLCVKMRSKNPDGSQLSGYTNLLHQFQDTLFRQGAWRFEYFLNYELEGRSWSMDKAEKIRQTKSLQYQKEAERIFNAMHKTFDNKNDTWKNWYGQSNDYIFEGYVFPEYDNPIYRFCNTAKNADYLNDIEKELFYVTNLARVNPVLFRNTFLKAEVPELFSKKGSSNSYETSLYEDLTKMKPAPHLNPDSALWRAAEFHANDLGKTGETGHTSSDGTQCFERIRKIAGKGASGENCSYGIHSSVGVLMQLLLDYGIESKGHRYNQLGNTHYAGIAHRPHSGYRWNTVFDFR